MIWLFFAALITLRAIEVMENNFLADGMGRKWKKSNKIGSNGRYFRSTRVPPYSFWCFKPPTPSSSTLDVVTATKLHCAIISSIFFFHFVFFVCALDNWISIPPIHRRSFRTFFGFFEMYSSDIHKHSYTHTHSVSPPSNRTKRRLSWIQFFSLDTHSPIQNCLSLRTFFDDAFFWSLPHISVSLFVWFCRHIGVIRVEALLNVQTQTNIDRMQTNSFFLVFVLVGFVVCAVVRRIIPPSFGKCCHEFRMLLKFSFCFSVFSSASFRLTPSSSSAIFRSLASIHRLVFAHTPFKTFLFSMISQKRWNRFLTQMYLSELASSFLSIGVSQSGFIPVVLRLCFLSVSHRPYLFWSFSFL